MEASAIVGYIRVSSKTQGASGLGLEAQRKVIEEFARQRHVDIVKIYTEVESGGHNDRPELRKAVAFARRARAAICVAKLDRLSRDVAFTSKILDTPGLEFIAIDLPEANRMTLQIMSVMAEYELRLGGERTKSALAEAKARGVKLGSHREGAKPIPEAARAIGRANGAAANRAKALAEYGDLLPEIKAMKGRRMSLRGIAQALNADGHRTSKGAAWSEVQVYRLLTRADAS